MNLKLIKHLGMLIAMLVYWLANGSPHYASMEATQNIAYMYGSSISLIIKLLTFGSSDVGATELKPLFIAGSCVTTVFLDLSFAADRWLRHRGTLVPNTTVVEKILSGLAILAGLVGTVGLICLSCFDTLHYPRMHDKFLAVFIVGYVLSAIFLCAEYQRLGKSYRQHRVLRISFWIKLAFILLEIALAIVFGVCSVRQRNVAAVTEWVIALIFTFWVLSFLVDLLPASRQSKQGKYGQNHGAGLEIGNGQGIRAEDAHQEMAYATPARNF
jgi:hypothetical protein